MYQDKFTLGIINFQDLNIGECKIEVYSGEGQIPHFHIFNSDNSFNYCVRIYENYFFTHGNKYTDILNSAQCRELDKWLSSNSTKAINKMTNWEAMVFAWEIADPDCKYPEYKKVSTKPYYSNMSMFKDDI